jgi:predicted RNA-binding protein with PUA-like domain
MSPVGFELTISAGERPQTYALDHAATATGTYLFLDSSNCRNERIHIVESLPEATLADESMNEKASDFFHSRPTTKHSNTFFR